ncbi:MAG: hypothetical protein ACI9FJ_000640 [Alteromonadaceae bacterium]|jgi:hypothetical protein
MMKKPTFLIALGCTGLLLLNYVDDKQTAVLAKLPMAVLISDCATCVSDNDQVSLSNKHHLLTLIQVLNQHSITGKTVNLPDMAKNK